MKPESDQNRDREGDPGNSPLSDEAMMRLVADGDRDAFAGLVRKYIPGLLNFFRRMNVYTADGDDLAQETFIRLFNYRAKYRPSARFTTFLYMIARQVQIDYFRKQQKRLSLAESVRKEIDESRVGYPRQGREADRKDVIEKALNDLSDEMRCVVVMSIYQGFKYSEIAEILDIPVGTVKTRMFHALKNLAKGIKHEKQ